jgi:hypothetical protein
MDAKDLVAPGLTAAVALFALYLNTIRKDRIAKERDSKYLAVQVVCELDAFVEECASVATNRGKDEYGNGSHVEFPEPPKYPDTLNWTSVDDGLMYDLLSIPAKTRRIASYVSGYAQECDDEDDYYRMRAEKVSKLGLRTYEICRRVRERFKLPAVEFDTWTPVERMQDELKSAEARQKQIEEFAKNAPPLPSWDPPAEAPSVTSKPSKPDAGFVSPLED